MGLFSKKKESNEKEYEKEKEKEIPEVEPSAQELFAKNLKYISQTEINAEDIANQFIKSETRFFLTVGQVDCPTGNIIISDPFYYLLTGKMCPCLAVAIPQGTYPVEVSICRNQYVGIRMCSARLKVKETKAVSYVCAEPTAESAVGKCADGILTGFPVDAGMMSFCDEQVAKEYCDFLGDWHKENTGKNHYEDYFADFFLESGKAIPAYQREDGDFIEWTNPTSHHKMVMVASGFGDGFYQCYWGYDSSNEICELLVPMVNPDLFD